MATRTVIGLSADACLNGIDAALLEVDGLGLELRVRVGHTLFQPFGRELREHLVGAVTPRHADARQLAQADRALGEFCATAARALADQASVSLQQVLCVGFPGLTAHLESEGRWPLQLTLAAPEVVAERTGLTMLSAFAERDLAAGGQGSPLSAVTDLLLFGDSQIDRLTIHLAGNTQVVVLPRHAGPSELLGWDAGPGLVFLNALVQEITGGKERTDANGRLAVQGRQLPELLETWSRHPFLLRKPPRSLPRAAFAEEFARQGVQLALQKGWSPHDLLCTANHLVVRSVVESVRRALPRARRIERLILTGPGARNGLLWRLLEDQFNQTPLECSDSYGIPAEAADAVRAGVLACLILDGESGSVPGVTGAAGPRLLGRLTPGSPANWARCLDWMTGNVYSAIGERDD